MLLRAAEAKKDEVLLRRIRGYELFACEARYHRRCLSNYCSVLYYRSNNQENIDEQNLKEAAHREAYKVVYDYIVRYIVPGKVCNLLTLREMYVNKLSETQFANPGYRNENLKEKIEKDKRINLKVSMVTVKPPNSPREFTIIFSKFISVASAVSKSFILAQADLVKDSAEFISDKIKTAYKESTPMPWPPTAADLSYDKVTIPPDLFRFLLILIGGSESQYSQRTERLASSIRQDFLKAVTNGDWKQPKHILLGTTLRHLFRSKEVIIHYTYFHDIKNQ